MRLLLRNIVLGATLIALGQGQSIKRDDTELKKGCEPGDEVIDKLPALGEKATA